jgi:hypothetical protein
MPVSADEDEESPLDPAVERIRQRLKRLIFISVATLMLGLFAVIIAVLYKVGPVRDKSGLAARPGESVVAGVLPPGARILSSALDGRLLALTIADGGATRILVIDLDGAKVVRRLSLTDNTAPATP